MNYKKHFLLINYSINGINSMLNSLLEDKDNLSYVELTNIHEARIAISEAIGYLNKLRNL